MNHPIAEIFSQGEEVITGQIVDTNAAWLAERLAQMGFVVSRHTAVGDKLTDLVALLKEISKRADFCICSGGLGPTIDDLTAEAVALAFSTPLLLDPIALANIEYYFSRRKRNMVALNQKQALLPKGAIRLDNHAGTAPGFALQHNRCWFVFVPGVPSEMKQMFTEQIKNKLEAGFVLQADKLISIKTIGMGEAEIQQRLIDFKLPQHVHLSFRATPEEVQSKLLFPADMAETTITHCIDQAVKSIGDAVFAVDELSQSDTTLIDVINVLIRQRKYSLSLIETFTQGLISAKCIGQDWLLASSYQQGINANGEKDLSQFAKEIAKNYNTDLVLIQLYQGESSQFHDKNKAIVLYNILITPQQLVKMSFTVVGSIQQKQNQAAIRALDFLRITLQTDAFTTTQ
ncbi:MAG: CinA family nicotinamide mononucleotide deamidase-related protein [Methylococcales symbiont of Iophon sp. n. MRB-2018]|nr:MAG: CinA family nicotinamide mononucleotide deamidase-related protein [Methylococcales symbiont of Iophon sp. n. MRB-2018]KAF3979363.1 MAG: CinA family nicotinamide mononucleotide deamidase-related protein [Methylococcales symbiont of Iophon sp. n. MRB-2018]